jgi:hypothetical protein
MNNDEYDNWINWIADGKANESTIWQISNIESLQKTSSYFWQGNPEQLSYEEAEELIKKLKENDNPQDPQDQYRKMFRDGVFNS